MIDFDLAALDQEEKKRLKAEQEANEVVGRINPVGAAIVMVFFGLLCVAVVFWDAIGRQAPVFESANRFHQEKPVCPHSRGSLNRHLYGCKLSPAIYVPFRSATRPSACCRR